MFRFFSSPCHFSQGVSRRCLHVTSVALGPHFKTPLDPARVEVEKSEYLERPPPSMREELMKKCHLLRGRKSLQQWDAADWNIPHGSAGNHLYAPYSCSECGHQYWCTPYNRWREGSRCRRCSLGNVHRKNDSTRQVLRSMGPLDGFAMRWLGQLLEGSEFSMVKLPEGCFTDAFITTAGSHVGFGLKITPAKISWHDGGFHFGYSRPLDPGIFVMMLGLLSPTETYPWLAEGDSFGTCAYRAIHSRAQRRRPSLSREEIFHMFRNAQNNPAIKFGTYDDFVVIRSRNDHLGRLSESSTKRCFSFGALRCTEPEGFKERLPYDLIVSSNENPNRKLRIQVKSARIDYRTVLANLCRKVNDEHSVEYPENASHRHRRPYLASEFDILALCCPSFKDRQWPPRSRLDSVAIKRRWLGLIHARDLIRAGFLVTESCTGKQAIRLQTPDGPPAFKPLATASLPVVWINLSWPRRVRNAHVRKFLGRQTCTVNRNQSRIT